MTDEQKIVVFTKLKQAQEEFEALGSPGELITIGNCILNTMWMEFTDSEFLKCSKNFNIWKYTMEDANIVHKEYIKKFGKNE